MWASSPDMIATHTCVLQFHMRTAQSCTNRISSPQNSVSNSSVYIIEMREPFLGQSQIWDELIHSPAPKRHHTMDLYNSQTSCRYRLDCYFVTVAQIDISCRESAAHCDPDDIAITHINTNTDFMLHSMRRGWPFTKLTFLMIVVGSQSQF